MHVIIPQYYKDLNHLYSTISDMVRNSKSSLSESTYNEAMDFLEMCLKARNTFVVDTRGIIYNGSFGNDIFIGKNGSRVVGVDTLRNFGRSVEKKVSEEAIKKAKS